MSSPVRVDVRVHPRAARPRRRWDGATLELWVRAPPAGGAANAAVLEAIASWLDVPRSRATIVRGTTSRNKVVQIDHDVALPPPDAETS